MKNRILFTLSLLIVFANAYSKTFEFKNFDVKAKGITIQVNTRLELFHIMAYLSNADYLNNFDFGYKSDIKAFFSSFQNNNDVAFVKKVLVGYYKSGAQLAINGLFTNEDFRENTLAQFLETESVGLTNTAENRSKILDSLENAVNSFAIQSHYDQFINAHKDYYLKKISEVTTTLNSIDLVAGIESFWGYKKGKYSIIIAMLEGNIHSYWSSGNPGLYSVFYLAPKFVMNNDAVFGNSTQTNPQKGEMTAKDYIYYGAWHEIGHSFLNPIMDNYNEAIDQLPLSTKDTKRFFLCESILRSLTAFSLIQNNQKDFAQMVLQGEKQQGFIHNEQILGLITDYSNNRNKFKNFNDYIPVFLNKLKQEIGN
jgi:hypothetical protein